MDILVADDDFGSRLVVDALLTGLGHRCRLAEDGDAAWRLFEEQPPDVIITDWLMPGVDGLELCRRIRARSGDAYTYVILVTSMGDRRDVLEGMQAGADDYLVKPVDPSALEATLVAARRVTALHEELRRSRVELERLNTELAGLASTDPLTGVRNRLAMETDLTTIHAGGVRYGSRYAIGLCDIDCFKAFNDTYGHPAGDEALRCVADTLVATLRQADAVYRYGGEEFLAILPEATPDSAIAAFERVRRAVAEQRLPHIGGPAGVITISAGVSAFGPGGEKTPEALLKEADVALYRAKDTGRNQVLPYAL